jgi:hypothetical protein
MAFDYKKFYSELTKGLPGAVSPEEVDFLKDQPMPSRSDRPDLFGDLSRVPLGREQAQNTAQMGKQGSDDLMEAYKSVTEAPSQFPSLISQEEPNKSYAKDLQQQLDKLQHPFQRAITSGEQEAIKDLQDRLFMEGREQQIAKGFNPKSIGTVFAGDYREVMPSGKPITEAESYSHHANKNIWNFQQAFGRNPTKAEHQEMNPLVGSMFGAQAMTHSTNPKNLGEAELWQQQHSPLQSGSQEYGKRLIEGSVPGVGALTDFQKETIKKQYGL